MLLNNLSMLRMHLFPIANYKFNSFQTAGNAQYFKQHNNRHGKDNKKHSFHDSGLDLTGGTTIKSNNNNNNYNEAENKRNDADAKNSMMFEMDEDEDEDEVI